MAQSRGGDFAWAHPRTGIGRPCPRIFLRTQRGRFSGLHPRRFFHGGGGYTTPRTNRRVAELGASKRFSFHPTN